MGLFFGPDDGGVRPQKQWYAALLQAKSAAMTDLDARKAKARAWFESLRDRIMAAFEALEDEAPAALYPGPAGRFERTSWSRGEDEGGGVMGMMRGRLFEKVGVHTSTVFGAFSQEFAKQVKGAGDDPRFWASGISLIAH